LRELRSILREVVAEKLEPGPVALLFSGGTDSLTVLWTLLDLGARPTCYTFHLSYYESPDARVSRAACEHWGVPQVVVTEDGRPRAEQVRDVVRAIGSSRKTHVEVMYGYWFLLEAAREEQVFTGLQADTLYGSYKTAAIRYGKASAADFAVYRRNLVASMDQEGLRQARLLARRFGKRLETPYTDDRVREFFFRYSWAQLNRPKQKMPPILAFEDRFREVPLYRHDDNMQVGSRLREHLGALLDDPEVNVNGRRSAAKLYEDLGAAT
jgi:asparagine synthetase B (glutamine-hydrolysing)